MKLSLIIWILFTSLLFQQKEEIYHVVHVKGTVINKKTKQALKLQDQLKPSDELIYQTPDARVVVYSTAKGRFLLDKPTADKAGKADAPLSEYWRFVKNLFMPASAGEHLSTRALETPAIDDLESFFGINTFVFIGDTYKLRVDRGEYPMSGGKYFVYKYVYNGTDYSKRIAHTGDTLIFDRKSLYTIKDQVISPEEAGKVDIYYFNARTSPLKITTMRPVFLPEVQLKKELQGMISILKNQQLSEESLIDQLYEHVVVVYGRTNRQMLKEWIERNLNI
ncbi:hypothetical protein GXP67_03690 [Rhodocytophaga rosea]|uniref:Uncharacterized protein n=1 Tax=Rhodocytophaga rosea TaxID=2704465 RepID=A0A6C0GCW9_9BACT|nr:hypothetical protein [Rhodocytophaga rosea]QHT65829.1 hypothetical protein GXP67_03690 [Rhodocytophaga rosea]